MKQNLIPEQRVMEEVKKAIAEGIDIDPARIKPESSLMKDLGAESLDFLDINYRLEQTFGIKMARRSVIDHIEELFGEESAIDSEGKLTGKAAEVLAIRYDGSGDQIRPGMDMDELPVMVTVTSIAEGVANLLDTLPGNCVNCGAQNWKLEEETRITCGSCGEPAAFTSGDDLIEDWLKQTQENKKIF
ncbi:MAG: phosphopantetheine-binding protein [Deltaproteobacteria bacterium]|jgi:acyl carrier protein|nr:phosphopantetheine-binding protein [Deltaproteobacteria bacterium]MDA8306432.1 phosphopantetheine-binding protein [Deltaproteobacteria bacterium]